MAYTLEGAYRIAEDRKELIFIFGYHISFFYQSSSKINSPFSAALAALKVIVPA